MSRAKLPDGRIVDVVGHATGPEYLSMPFDAGRVADRVVGKPKPGTPMTQVRHDDGGREWWPARQVTTC